MIDRRKAMLGLAGLAIAAPAFAKSGSPVAHGILANNQLARAFEATTTSLPNVTIIGPKGEFDIKSLFGRTILMPLWAEWCAPCLSELPDFARLQQKYSNDKFAVLPILTGSQKKFTIPYLANLFNVLNAGALTPLMEKKFGDKLAAVMARKGRGYSLPCNLLIAPDGTVVGREVGRVTADDAYAGPAPEKTKDPETITRAINGQAQSLWGKREGEEFAAAMATGFLG